MSERAYLLSKSYVGGGQFRSLASLSSQARGVVRRNLEAERSRRLAQVHPNLSQPLRGERASQVRPSRFFSVDSAGEARARRPGVVGFGSSPQQRAADARRKAAGVGLKDRVFGGQNVASRATSVANMRVSEATSPNVQRMLERTFSGRRLRNPVTVDANPNVNGGNFAGIADDASGGGGREKIIRLYQGHRGFTPGSAVHEMRHAQASTRKGRISSLPLRKFPNRSLQREEAAADAASMVPGQRRLVSGYRQKFGPGSVYDEELTRQVGRRPRDRSLSSVLRAETRRSGERISADERPEIEDLYRTWRSTRSEGSVASDKQRGVLVRRLADKGRVMREQNRRTFFRQERPLGALSSARVADAFKERRWRLFVGDS